MPVGFVACYNGFIVKFTLWLVDLLPVQVGVFFCGPSILGDSIRQVFGHL
jgi:hypothetical protein